MSQYRGFMFRLIIITGGAIFAMFFGAGNLVFPLDIGVKSGVHLDWAIVGFFLSGILIPLLGLYVISLYHGNYMHFFSHLGRIPGFIVALVIIFLIGLVVGTPRCGLLSYNTFLPLFPALAGYHVLFNALFFLGVYLISIKQNRVVDALGWVLSPLKLSVLFILIVFGVAVQHHPLMENASLPALKTFGYAIEAGYSTMDLLAGIFFCAFVHRSIRYKLSKKPDLNTDRAERQLTLYACLVGALLLAVVYSFFILIANYHANDLQGIPTQKLIGSLSLLLLHEAGGVFVAICVGLACFSTAVAVTAITVEFIHTHIFRHKISYRLILPLVVVIVFILSTLGFTRLMHIAIPILNLLYPALLGLTIGNIIYKLKGWNAGPVFFIIGLFISFMPSIFSLL
jgi:LIVCS family branched-chain amino acid:cation transporter